MKKSGTLKRSNRGGRHPRTLAACGIALLMVGGGAAIPMSASARTSVPSWEEFRDATYQDEDGQFIVNGDETVSDEFALREFYDRLAQGVMPSTSPGDLIANKGADGFLSLWSMHEVGSLSYCVSDAFGSAKAAVVQAMEEGAATWEGASSAVNFDYLPEHDARCNTRNSSVTFSVEPTRTTAYIARAFFPDTPKTRRNILVSNTLTTSGWSAGNIMAHELGHVLGFRHEHTRPEAGTCFEDNNWEPLTPYDSISIMHYPQCNGDSSSLEFSHLDYDGIQVVYGQ